MRSAVPLAVGDPGHLSVFQLTLNGAGVDLLVVVKSTNPREKEYHLPFALPDRMKHSFQGVLFARVATEMKDPVKVTSPGAIVPLGVRRSPDLSGRRWKFTRLWRALAYAGGRDVTIALADEPFDRAHGPESTEGPQGAQKNLPSPLQGEGKKQDVHPNADSVSLSAEVVG
jgi:hypothetical protein